ncbi:MAG TPA: hypothetical protein PKC76_03440 [Saprospiraceae bacterium]|nr:hypothetical protein [Saprospiraceae bacterium]HMP23158.1 hypothetical protein [Saprospiraceae bacterium]
MMKNLLTIMGFLLAGFCFFAWYGNREGTGTPYHEQPAIAEAGAFGADVFGGSRTLERPSEVSSAKSAQSARQSEPIAAATAPGAGRKSFQREVQMLSDIAIAGALDQQKQIPAGAALALLIYSAERGKQADAANLRRVIDYLDGIRYEASKDDRGNYFKYASNSEKWFAGLALDRNGAHPKTDLLRIYQAYNLQQYDKSVFAKLTNAAPEGVHFDKTVTPQSKAPAMKGDPSVEEVRRNQAYAKNRWVENAGKNSDADVRFLPSRSRDRETVSEARSVVQALRVGESLTFDEPDIYHAAVKEMIAFENGYANWQAYETGMGRSNADKVFRKRAEKGGFMATGTLKLTRER